MSVAKRGDASKKGDLVGELSIHALQAESIFPVAYNEEKNKEDVFMFLMFLCQHGRVYVETRKMNVFVKPNEQRRSCSNIVMARNRTFEE